MKKALPMPLVIGSIALIVAAIIAAFLWSGKKPSTPEEAGLGKPAVPGGGTTADPSKGPAANP